MLFKKTKNLSKTSICFLLCFMLLLCMLFSSSCIIAQKNAYQEKLSQWNNYKNVTMPIFKEYKDKIRASDNLYMESSFNYDGPAAKNAADQIVKTYEEYITKVKEITPPEFAADLHKYQIESLELEKKKWADISNDPMLFVVPDESIESAIKDAVNKIGIENEKIKNSLIEEAARLKLPAPS